MAFCAGLVGGGVATASVLLVVGSLLRGTVPAAARWSVIGVGLVVVLLRDRGVVSFGLPENRRLVPETVFRLGRHLGPLQFGLEMGTGVRTYLPSGLPYAASLAVLLAAPVSGALAAGAGFGFGRALMLVSSLRYGVGDEDGWPAAWRRHSGLLAAAVGSAFASSLAAALVAAVVPAGW